MLIGEAVEAMARALAPRADASIVWVTFGHVAGTPPGAPTWVFHRSRRFARPSVTRCGLELEPMIALRRDSAGRLGRPCRRCHGPDLGL